MAQNDTFRVVRTQAKGNGLVAGVTGASSGTRILKVGVEITPNQLEIDIQQGIVHRYLWEMKRRNPTTRRLEVFYLDGNPEYRQMLGNPMLASYINEPGPGEHPNCYDIGSHIVLDERVQPGEEALVSYGPGDNVRSRLPGERKLDIEQALWFPPKKEAREKNVRLRSVCETKVKLKK